MLDHKTQRLSEWAQSNHRRPSKSRRQSQGDLKCDKDSMNHHLFEDERVHMGRNVDFFCREQEKGDIGPINTKPEFWQILEVTCKPVL